MRETKWPELNYEDWKETCQTLHRWVQIVGKIRLSKSPWLNHSWNATLYVTERGLTTSVIHDPEISFSIELDFLSHRLEIRGSDGQSTSFPLERGPVAAFFDRCLESLRQLGIDAMIYDRPNELPDSLPFPEDRIHRAYDPDYVHRFHQVLLRCDGIMKEFRSRFTGKASPVHLFWGSFDLATTRFSGRTAPEHPGGVPHLPDRVAKEAYSHEVSSCGFWPGGERYPRAAFYSYAYPQPEGFASARTAEGAYFDEALREFILPYDVVREASSPEERVLEFFERTYDAAARLGKWNRQALDPGRYFTELHGLYSRTRRSSENPSTLTSSGRPGGNAA